MKTVPRNVQIVTQDQAVEATRLTPELNWRDGRMVLAWTAAGMLNAERSFRRIKGYKQMPQLIAALHRHAHPDTASMTETVGAAA